MPSPIENEIIGDWNNLKGTEYHLVYVLWLILFRKVPAVAFYQGNDLLAHPIPPPALGVSQDEVISMHSRQHEMDEWIQLKATEEPWTLSLLLKENLLANFIYNALSSERDKKSWTIQLITQANIQKKAVESFIANPKLVWSHHTVLHARAKSQTIIMGSIVKPVIMSSLKCLRQVSAGNVISNIESQVRKSVVYVKNANVTWQPLAGAARIFAKSLRGEERATESVGSLI